MGIFDFLKKSSKKETKEIRFDELDKWTEIHSKNIFDETNSRLMELREKIEEERKKLEENIKILEKAELKNPNIPERAKQIMHGNRRLYVFKVNKLLDEIYLPKDFDDIIVFCGSIDKSLDNFSKTTLRSYYILQDFFRDYVIDTSSNIKKIGILTKTIKETIENSGIDKINDLRNKLNNIQKKIKLKENFNEDINILKKDMEKQNKRIKEKEKKLKKFEEESRYKKFIDLMNRKKVLERKLEDIGKEILYSFSDIKVALKKYERITLEEKLVGKYLDEPFKTLLDDKGLKIIEIITKMKESIEKNEIELKDRKKSKILKDLNNLNKNYFETFFNKYNEINKDLEKLKLEIKDIEIKDIEDLREEIKKDNSKLEEDKNKVNEMIKELMEINIEGLKENLERSIKENIEDVKVIY